MNKKGLDFYIYPKEKGETKIPELLKRFDEVIYNPFNQIIQQTDPIKWGKYLTKRLLKIKKTNLPKEIVKYIENYMWLVWDAMRVPIKDGSIPRTTIYAIQELDKFLPEPCGGISEIKFISIEDYCKKTSSEVIVKNGIEYLIIKVDDKKLSIPLMDKVLHKGGSSRVVLKKLFGSKYMGPELPLKDWDIIVPEPKYGNKFMEIVGEKDLSGIEINSSMEKIMYGRDTTINLCILGKEGLYYCLEAESAVITGLIRPCSGDHGIYGKDYFIYKGHRFIKGRVFERLCKMIIEIKAGSFAIKKENLQVNMGPSVLMGICRTMGKIDCYERIERFYYLLKKMGQLEQFQYIIDKKVGMPCRNIFEFLDGIHTVFPFVMLENRGQDDGIARWLFRRLLKWFRDDFKRLYSLSEVDFTWIEIDPDEKEVIISLDDFQSDPKLLRKMREWFPGFLKRCRERNIEHDKK